MYTILILYNTITSYPIVFARPIRSFNVINFVDNDQNNPWYKGAYSLISETRSYGIASNIITVRKWKLTCRCLDLSYNET